MSDLISRAEALKYIPSEEPISRMVIAQLPTIEAEPVKHGRWEIVYFDNIPTLAHCSRCDQMLRFTRENEKTPNYCPNCGAKMDGGEDD